MLLSFLPQETPPKVDTPQQIPVSNQRQSNHKFKPKNKSKATLTRTSNSSPIPNIQLISSIPIIPSRNSTNSPIILPSTYSDDSDWNNPEIATLNRKFLKQRSKPSSKKKKTTKIDVNTVPPHNITCDKCKRIILVASPHISCAECPDFDLCLDCFASGVEIYGGQKGFPEKDHLKSHKYYLIHDLDFPLVQSDWSAIEELILLDSLLLSGFGNWVEIASRLDKRSPEECEKHYIDNYISSPTFPIPDISTYRDQNSIIDPNSHLSHPISQSLQKLSDDYAFPWYLHAQLDGNVKHVENGTLIPPSEYKQSPETTGKVSGSKSSKKKRSSSSKKTSSQFASTLNSSNDSSSESESIKNSKGQDIGKTFVCTWAPGHVKFNDQRSIPGQHFTQWFEQNPPFPNSKKSKKKKNTGSDDEPYLWSSVPSASAIRGTSQSSSAVDSAGWMPFRDDFDKEYQDEAELNVKDIFFSESDTKEERLDKTRMLSIYNSKLVSRSQRKMFCFDRNIIHNYRAPSIDTKFLSDIDDIKLFNNIVDRVKVFERHQSAEDHKALLWYLFQDEKANQMLNQAHLFLARDEPSLSQARKSLAPNPMSRRQATLLNNIPQPTEPLAIRTDPNSSIPFSVIIPRDRQALSQYQVSPVGPNLETVPITSNPINSNPHQITNAVIPRYQESSFKVPNVFAPRLNPAVIPRGEIQPVSLNLEGQTKAISVDENPRVEPPVSQPLRPTSSLSSTFNPVPFSPVVRPMNTLSDSSAIHQNSTLTNAPFNQSQNDTKRLFTEDCFQLSSLEIALALSLKISKNDYIYLRRMILQLDDMYRPLTLDILARVRPTLKFYLFPIFRHLLNSNQLTIQSGQLLAPNLIPLAQKAAFST